MLKFCQNRVLLVFSLFLLMNGCGPAVRFSSENDKIPKANKEKIFNRSAEKDSTSTDDEIIFYDVVPIETVTGVASFYADDFNGKITYSGEIYDMYGLTAAHPTYPMGTILIVTNLENGRGIELRINDKMPPHPERIIDLSYGSADALGIINSGLANVMVEVIELGKGRQ